MKKKIPLTMELDGPYRQKLNQTPKSISMHQNSDTRYKVFSLKTISSVSVLVKKANEPTTLNVFTILGFEDNLSGSSFESLFQWWIFEFEE